jgi:hypothetical protein
MQAAQTNGNSKKMLLTGRALTVLAALFMLLDGVMKLVKPVSVVEATLQLGYPESTLTGIGVALIISTVIYLIPRTSILGAILLTGYLGGAVASNVRVQSGWFNTLFPIVFAVVIWGSIWLREPRLRELLSLTGNSATAQGHSGTSLAENF